MSTESLIRITVCFNCKPGLTEKEFNDHWAYTHGPLVREWLRRCGVVKYVQNHTTSEFKSLARKKIDAKSRTILPFDAVADFWVRKYEDWEAAFQDPYYKEKVEPDERRLIDFDTVSMTIGTDHIVIEEGNYVEEHMSNF